MEYQGKISGTGNHETRLNEITADDVATLRNYIIGWESGVIFNGFPVENQTETSVTIGNGFMLAFGYIGQSFGNKTFIFNRTSATQYHFIYVELDRSVIPNTCIVKTKNNQGGSEPLPTTFRQDILSQVKTGVYQLPLYRITLTSSGVTEIKDYRDKKQSIKKVNKVNSAKKCIGSLSRNVEGITQPISDNSKKPATTMFVHNAIRDYIDNN